MNKPITKICFVQPVQSPYWTERLKVLAQQTDLELTLLLEQGTFAHRPGWQPESINDVKIKVLHSVVLPSTSIGDDLGYRIQGNRSIPWRLTIALWRLRPDIIVLCNATQILLSLPLKILMGYRIALIVEDTPHASRNLSQLTRQIKSWAYRRADRWFAFSEDAKTFLAQIGINNDVERSSWSLDMTSFKPSMVAELDHVKPDIKKHTTVIFVGALIERKGIRLLLSAWSCLPYKIRQKSKLHIVGSGPLKDELLTFARKNELTEVDFVGQVNYEEVKNRFRNSDLFVLPTLEDLCSLTVLEAMASACPVITTPYNGARELVDKNNGWIVDPTEPDIFRAVLEEALSGQVDLHKMGMAARKRVENMDNEIVMNKFAESLRHLASRNKK